MRPPARGWTTFHLRRYGPYQTRSFACFNDSNVPASVHQPGKASKVNSPRWMYALLTSVISSSPRPEGISVRILSNTVASYM